MSEITQLTPKLLWKWFDQICAIPHPSYQENELAEFIVNWAKQKGLYAKRDEVGNVLIRKTATVGMEHCKKVALQAHLDMVPQANEATQHDFSKDPIRPVIDGEWVRATGTTLGADNGIGLASALAVLESDDLAHPDLEILLTMTEERGMEGALGLRPNWLQSEIMINTDTEESGEIYVGCAGGENANITLPIEWQNNTFAQAAQICLKGLRGGHSGVDIHTNRANAIKILARLLANLSQQSLEVDKAGFTFTLSDIRGGSIRNAIPREAFATLAFNGEYQALQSAVENFKKILQTELALAEPNLSLEINMIERPTQVFSLASSRNVINALQLLPNGVIRQSDVIKGVVETSLSVGVLKTEENGVKLTILTRSLIESGKQEVASRLKSLVALVSGSLELSGSYPGWEPQRDSEILSLTEKVYTEILGHAPEIKVIHAGLECGLLKKIYPHIDMVSVGPTIINAHSPDEKVHIPAVEIYWQLLTKILASIPAK